jgi:hypothetical protein
MPSSASVYVDCGGKLKKLFHCICYAIPEQMLNNFLCSMKLKKANKKNYIPF